MATLRFRILISLLLVWLGMAAGAQAFRVVIDAGHGGHDLGARTGSVYEKHLALDVARRLDRYLKRRGISTSYTRSRNNFISLDRRVAIGNRSRHNTVFVSIHFNSAQRLGAEGIETFYYTAHSRFLAEIVHYNMIQKLGPTDRGVKHRGFRVIKSARNPAILVEGGFLSNSSECRRCLSPTYRQKLAEAIGYGLIRYNKMR